jgi:ribonuclease D
MLEYAAADTRHLPVLRDLLRDRLRELGRLEWAEEEFELLTAVRRSALEPSEPGYLRIKGAKALSGRSQAILRELFQWREELARRTDKAAFRIMNNEPMVFMAKSPPTELAALKAIKGIGQEQVDRRGKEILAAVQRGLEIPDRDLPRIERPLRRQPDAAYEARMERLKSARNALATQYNLAPGVLCANGVLEAIARVNPATLEQMAGIKELRRWQLREMGGSLLAAVQKPAAKPA